MLCVVLLLTMIFAALPAALRSVTVTLELLVLTHRPMSVPLLGASHVTCTILRSDAASEMLMLGVRVFISNEFLLAKLLFTEKKEVV